MNGGTQERLKGRERGTAYYTISQHLKKERPCDDVQVKTAVSHQISDKQGSSRTSNIVLRIYALSMDNATVFTNDKHSQKTVPFDLPCIISGLHNII